MFLYFKAEQIEYKPMLDPISQKTISIIFKLSIHSKVSGSLVKKVFTLYVVNSLGIKKFLYLKLK